MKKLLKGAGILAWENDDFKYIPNGYIAINGDTIEYVGSPKPDGDYEVIDLSGKLLMPGLYNCHTHAAMTLLRGVGSDLPLHTWLFEKVMPIEAKLTPEEISAGNELAMMEMIASGVVSFTDMYMQPRTAIKLNEHVGMKMNLSRVVQSFDPTETADKSQMVREAFELYNECNGLQDDRIRIDFGIHAEYTINDSVMRGYSEMLHDYIPKGAVMHLHLSETYKEHEECIERHGMTPAAWLDSYGIFDMPTAAAHCVAVSDEDLEIFRDKYVSPIHNPTSNLKLGSGFAPIPKMIDMGINVTLGTDGAASNNNLNMFEEMHLAAIIHNGYLNNPEVMKPGDVLKMATVNGARLQGRTDSGCIMPGKKADIIAVDFDNRAHMYPYPDPIPMLVYSAQASDVYMTMVDGKVLYRDGEYLTIDKDKAFANARKAVAELFGEA